MLRVLHLTDTHVVAVEEEGDGPPLSFAAAVALVQGRSTTELLQLVLDAVADDGWTPDLVLHTGDVVDDGDAASYERIRAALDPLGAPVLAVPGNHDRADVLAAAFEQTADAVRSTDAGGWRVVTIDTAAFERDHGELDAAALYALEQALGTAAGPVLIGLHHPPVSVCDDPSCQLRQSAELLAVIDRHPAVRAVVSGHLHVTEDLDRNGVRYLLSPSSCLQLQHEHPLPEHNRAPTRAGARLLELGDDGAVRSRLLWAG